MGKISGPCKAAAKKKFEVWPSAYASGWGVRCTNAGGPGVLTTDASIKEGLALAEFSEETAEIHSLGTNNPHLFRLFTEAFCAQDISEPVRSFDALRPSAEILALMELHDIEVVCLRRLGAICGYVKRADLQGKLCGDHMRPFRSGQTISADSSLIDVIHILTLQRYGFITMLGEVAGYFSRNDINKPVVRMWLFGIITFIEMEILKIIIE